MKKRVFRWLIALAVVLPCLLLTAFAAEGTVTASGTCGTNLTWTLYEDGELVISGTGKMDSWSSESNAPWYSNRRSIKTVTIGDSVTSIGNWAFYKCTSLTDVTIGKGVTSIGDYVFWSCTSLTSVTISDGVTNIGNGMFISCTSLTKVTIPDSVTSIGGFAFYGCASLTGVSIGKGVTSIGGSAFYDCGSLTSVTIPDSVTRIGNSAFSGCTSLTTVRYTGDVAGWCGVAFGDSYANPLYYADSFYIGGKLLTTQLVIPQGVTAIEGYAFYNCDSLTKVSIPTSVTSIGDSAFYDCTSLTGVTIGKGVTSIGDYAFCDCTSLTSVTIPDSVTSIGWRAFYKCTSLTDVTIGKGVTSIGEHAFYDCTSLTTVRYTGDVAGWCGVTFGDYSANPVRYADSFYIDGNLLAKQLVIPQGVTAIKDYAFYGCDSPTSVTIPDSVTSIGDSVFAGCYMLAEVTIPDSVTSIGGDAFLNCTRLTTVRYTGDVAGWCGIAFGDSYANPVRYADSFYIGGKLLTTQLVIPQGVTAIEGCAFSGCDSLTSVTIPDSVTSIGNSAFASCASLTSVTITSSVTSIGESAFGDCSALTRVDFLGNVPALDYTGVFEGGTKVAVYYHSGTTGWLESDNYNAQSGTWCGYRLRMSSAPIYFITANDSLGGTVTVAPTMAMSGATITVTATPDEGYALATIFVDGKAIEGNTFTVAGNHEVTATFEKLYSITVGTVKNGTVTVTPTMAVSGATITVTATPEEGYALATIFVDGKAIEGNTFTVAGNHEVTATFEKLYSITVGTVENGTVTVMPAMAVSGATITVTATPAEGYELEAICVDGKVINGNTFSVAGNHEVTATFKAELFASGKCGANLTWGLYYDGELVISGTGGMDSWTSVSNVPWYSNRSSIKTVTIGDSVTRIGNYAFRDCASLTSVTIPDSVTSIGGDAFYYCTSLTTVRYTGDVAGWCGIAFGDSYANPMRYADSFYIGGKLLTTQLVIPQGVTAIKGYAFYNCDSLTSVTIPDSVTSIGYYAFYNCASLTSVTMGNGVTSIGGWAFYNCDSLTSVTIPDSVTSIGNYAFRDCASLTSVTIPDSVTSIGGYAFRDCASLTSVWYTGDVAGWCGVAFGDSYANPMRYADFFYIGRKQLTTQLVIPQGVTAIKDYAFYNCSRLTSVTIPDSVTSIGDSAFYNCASLTSVTIPDSVTSIGDSAFYNCSRLTSVTIPDGVTSIGDCAFYNCYSLTSLTVGKGVTTIKNNVFKGCGALTRVEFLGNAPVPLFDNAFADCNQLNVYYHEGTTGWLESDYYDTEAGTWCGRPLKMIPAPIWSITVNNATGGTVSINKNSGKAGEEVVVTAIPAKGYELVAICVDGVAIDGNTFTITGNHEVTATFKAELYASGICGANLTWDLYYDGEMVISGAGEMTSHGWSAFRSYIKTVIIGDSVTAIGSNAFEECANLTKVSIPASVTTIADHAFYRCTSLTEVTIPDSVNTIGDYAFYWCTGLTEMTIPDGVNTIGDYAFSCCTRLTKVTIPDSVTTIGSCAFYECVRLNTVLYTGDMTGWCEIAFGDLYANALCYAKSLYVGGDLLTTQLDIPQGVTTIKDYTFCWCTGLTKLTIPDSVTSIGDYAFYNCDSVTTVTITSNVTSIGESAFYNCSELTRVDFWGNVPAMDYTRVFEGGTKVAVYYHIGTTGWLESDDYHAQKGTWCGYRLLMSAVPIYFITVSDSLGGTVTVAPTMAMAGTAVTVTAIPAKKHEFVAIYVDGTAIEGNTFTVTGAHEVTATFKKVIVLYDITVGAVENGTVTVTPTQAEEDDTVTVTATPAEGYELEALYVDGTAIQGNTFTVTGNHEVTATFADASLFNEITVGGVSNGTVTVNPAKAKVGATITVTATPAEGYELEAIYVDGTAIQGNTFTVTGAHEVTATFKKIIVLYDITVGTVANGTVTVNPTKAEAGDTVTVTATPAEGYELVSVLVDGKAIQGTKFTVTGNHTVSAKFELNIAVPAKPHNIVNTVSGVHVYWKAVSGAEKYGLWRSETGKNGTYKWIANPTVPHFTDTKVESGKTYFYKVTSMLSGKHSEMSEALGISFLTTPDITARYNKAAGIKLEWNQITGATGYRIYRKSYSGTDAWVKVGEVTGEKTLTWTDESVKNNNGTVYRYTVRAVKNGTLSGCRNTGRTMVRLASRVLNSATKASATSIKCSWTTSAAVTGYEMRFVVNGQVVKTVTIGNYKTGVKTFTGLPAGQKYQVQVRAYKKVDGVGSFYSAWSTAKYVQL